MVDLHDKLPAKNATLERSYIQAELFPFDPPAEG